MAAISHEFRSSNSFVLKAIESSTKGTVTLDSLRSIVQKVEEMEASGSIAPWEEESLPEDIVSPKPVPGQV